MLVIYQQFFWVISIIATSIYGGFFYYLCKSKIIDREHLKIGLRVSKGIILVGNVPWIAVGLGMIFGKIPYFLYYLFPTPFNPWIALFHISVVAVWIIILIWVLIKNGAKEISILLKELGGQNVSELTIKILILICIAGGVMGIFSSTSTGFSRDSIKIMMEGM